MTVTICLVALFLAGGTEAAPPPQPAPTAPAAAATAPRAAVQDPAALAIVRKMSDRLKAARTFSFRARVSLELPVAAGELATYFTTASVAVRRPDGLRATRGGDLPELQFAYDGKTMTTFVPGTGQWGSAAAPPTIDAMLVAASEQGGLSFLADELVVADPLAAIVTGSTDVAHVGRSTAGGRAVEHVLATRLGLRLEYWIDAATALPVRALVVYADHALRPHLSVELSDWKLDPKLPPSTFALPRPAGVKQVGFREASSAFR
jgi:hypothetical protein